MQLTAIILAGGKSTRMGTDKALMTFKGRSLLDNAIDICKPVCQDILISSNNPAHQTGEIPVVFDEYQNCGPMGGLYSGLKKSKTEWNFVLSVDSPFIKPEFIKKIISEIDDVDAVVPIHKKGKEPLVAFYHKNCLPEIETRIIQGNFAIYKLFESIHIKFVESEYWLQKYPDLFYNVNRPEDLKKI